MESVDLRYFIAVAEELHFTRAAERLHMAQPPLSRAIRHLEDQLEVLLFERTSRRVELTPAGRVLLEQARGLISAMSTAARRTQDAAAGTPRIALAVKTGASESMVADILAKAASIPDFPAIELLLCDAQEQTKMLLEGRADAALLHLPYEDTTGLDFDVIKSEDQVALLPKWHPLAMEAVLRMDQVINLPELPLARWPSSDGSFEPGEGDRVRNTAQLMQFASLERIAVVLPSSSAVVLPEALVAIPLIDAPRVTTVIAWPAGSRSRIVADLVQLIGGLSDEISRSALSEDKTTATN